MNTKTKIIVIRSKELLVGAILCFLIIFIIVMLIITMGNDNSSAKTSSYPTGNYTAGVYTSSLTLSGNPLEIEVCVDANNICSIDLKNTNTYVETMYPLLDSTLNHLEAQICSNNGLENIQADEDNQYTSMILLDAIKEALNKAAK